MCKDFWKSSSAKLHSTKYLAIMAIMIASKVVVSGFFIPVGENLKIGLTFVLVAIEATILGPAAGMVSGAITDIVGFMIHPSGMFFPGYTLTAMLGELNYALFFYRHKITLPRIIGAKLCANYLINVALGSLWSAMMFSKGYIFYATKSLIKNTALLPIEIFILYTVFRLVTPNLKKRNLIFEDLDSPK